MKFYITTLGCKVNTYESSVMADNLTNAGYIKTDKLEEADICIVNTCTVTNTSDNKSLKATRQIRRKNPHATLIVCGCMTQVSKNIDELDADIIIGNIYKSSIVRLISEYLVKRVKLVKVDDINETSFEDMKLNNFDRTRAFVKIEDGCENFCSYCIIPYARGKVRSKKSSDVLKEIIDLVNNNHQEIVLTGIHTGHYGADLDNYNFANLLSEIVKIEGLKRLRISSIEITEITDEILNIIALNNIIVDHLHVPLQSGSDAILKLMNRKYDKKYFQDKIESIRKIRPNISITTDVIVGFPEEDEELFEETIDTILKIRFSKIHVFPFSLREGTKACELLNHVDQTTKKQRVKRLIEISKMLETEYALKFLNKTVTYIPEVYDNGYIIGHTGNYLLIKEKGSPCELHREKEFKIKEFEYPYCK